MGDLRKNLIERRFVELDPLLAKHYLVFNTFEGQRNIKAQHLKELSDKMKDGRFRFGEIAFADYPQKYQRDIMMNGQHVCSAVIASGVTVQCVMEKFKVDTESDLSELFRQFEIQARSLQDMIKVEALSLGLNWHPDFTGLIVSAAKLDIRRDKKQRLMGPGTSITKEQSVRLVRRYLKEGEWISSIMTSRKQANKHLWRTAIVYVMFNTFRKSQSDSIIFWQRVKNGENLTKDMPEMKLREFLLQSLIISASSKYGYRKADNHEFICRNILAWNSFRTGKTTNLRYRPGSDIPKIK